MRIKLIASALVVETERGRFSTRIDFEEGVNVVSAHNNRGKTTALMSVIYALGLEGMVGPGDPMPLKPAAYELVADADGTELPVLSSYVMLELENADGKRLTAQRYLKHERFKRDLVRTWEAGKLTDPQADVPVRERYTRVPGAAQNEAGWHTQLTRFLGWQLPRVTTWTGDSVPLYMQSFWPLLFVEQSRGWASIFGAIPRYLRIRDPGRRAVEFLLQLDAYERARRREELLARDAALTNRWRSAVGAFVGRLDTLGGRLQDVSPTATVEWPPASPPTVRLLHDEQWVPLGQLLRTLRQELAQLENEEVPRAADVVGQATSDLRDAEDRLARLSALSLQAAQDLRNQEADQDALEERLAALTTDRQRYSDALRLRGMGALQPLSSPEPHCPTCQQALPATLHGAGIGGPVLTLEANLELIDSERHTVQAIRADASEVLRASRERATAVRQALLDARRDVRTLKSALTQQAQAPSRAVVARQVRVTDRLEALEEVDESFSALEQTLAEIAEELRKIRGELEGLKAGRRSEGDEDKLSALALRVREQLDQYGYGSFAGVEVDPDTYLPEREGFDLDSDSSASDTVRLVWAYTVGLLEVARQHATNHPGLLVMDEPGQHEIEIDSLRALFRRVAASRQREQQVVIATSMPFHEVDALGAELDLAVHRFDDRVLTRDEDNQRTDPT
ncbi:SMC family protein [Candidatus Solirubrobacter pratensis]|uniref:hypothetical protein n=1 Tax=Candidatus Solirubrobacter pratensis TaxID=1298857 RepID=UPI000412C08A|nr:hypothetical protein [Candidatus Solirubrobacter pratensis]